jgi:hypothetical protein
MKKSVQKNLIKNRFNTFVWLVIPFAFAAAILLLYPFRFRFELDADEGVNLIKAMMTLKGFRLYSDIWSDQPPIFNALLTVWFRLLGMNVNAGRILVLGFSTVLLISAMHYLQRFWGIPHALLGIFAIITLPFYKSLSVSIMIGLPAIAFAMLSFVGLMRWHEDSGIYWLIFSAISLALSVMTKLWTGILAPLFFAGIFIQKSGFIQEKLNLRDSLRPSMTWALWFIAGTGLIILLLVGPIHAPELVGVHLAAGETENLQSVAEGNPMLSYLDDSIPLYFLSLAGVIIAIRTRKWHALYFVAWTLAAYLLLSWNSPFWHHHQLLITIPAAMLGAIAMGYASVDLYQRIRTSNLWTPEVLPAVLIAALSIIFAFQRIPPTVRGLRLDLPNIHGTYDAAELTDFEIVAIMRNYADKTNLVFTDRPMYAFRSGLPVHPYLAVMTRKRYSTGQLSQEEILAILEGTKPEQVILGRFDIPAVQEYMKARNFVRVDNSPRSRHYVKGEILETPWVTDHKDR